MEERHYCPCYGGGYVTARHEDSWKWRLCPNDDSCPKMAAKAACLRVRADGGYEVAIPGWGHVGEVSPVGLIDSRGEDAVSPPLNYSDVERAFAVLCGARCDREARVGYHYGHPVADLVSAVAIGTLRPTTPWMRLRCALESAGFAGVPRLTEDEKEATWPFTVQEA